MPFPNIDPVLIHLGPIAIRWYALAYVAGIMLGWRYAVGLARNPRLWGAQTPTATPAQLDDLVLWLTLGVIGGGRLGSILFYSPETIWKNPIGIFKVWEGGMSFHGGLIGVCIAIAVFAWRNKIDMLRLGDLIAPAVPIGLFFGRVANFVNGELWGRVTDVPWAMVFCNQRLLEQGGGACAAGTMPRHPSQLYEAGLEGLALFLILRFATHRAGWLQKQGGITGLFLFCYGLFRALLENVRQPDAGLDHLPFGLTMGIILSTPMVLAGAWLIWRASRQPTPDAA
ncbi:MAG: prolipoprotein diacylglyceryl transferase [Caulobacteraceae bacterium]